MYDFKVVQGCN